MIERIALSEAVAFKVCVDPWGLLRPDKFVIYLPTIEAAGRLHDALAPLVSELDVQQLPFTAPLDQRGAVSLGFDPHGAWSTNWESPAGVVWCAVCSRSPLSRQSNTARHDRLMPH
ncbi:hypothetical protein [Microlunatus sp. Gsoil 973]|uniref:hypothetical protein n=1 Tax=Microlunatus sp. Gsoil 973 TaxID=2672569 RepID=UPI0012B46666|nr:hypothetical protein [Microlunatus sp. Gsoil 973]QGN32014.1 hypothetical protein GJV80_03500 [Microlunatus sp. Gsoil 973]